MHRVHAPPAATDARRYPAPVAARRALAVAELLAVASDGSVLDLGGAPAGPLFDAVTRNGCRGHGLVRSAAALPAARAAAEREGLAARVEFSAATPAEFVPTRRYDAILCLGDLTHPRAALDDAAGRCRAWLRGGGLLVCGEPFLRRAPAPAYRALLASAGEGLRMPGRQRARSSPRASS
jgi:cyclopropane fatty-acyl-phospholipid synthase-like methyltransferase